jgi:hypothetical protein
MVVISTRMLPAFVVCACLEELPGVTDHSHLLALQHATRGAKELKVALVLGGKVHWLNVRSCATHEEVDVWLRAHVLAPGVTCVGVDLEWRPTFGRTEAPSRVALVQVAARDECLLVPLLHMRPPGVPALLRQVLSDSSIRKVGVGVCGDAVRLRRDWAADIIARVDLATAAAEHGLKQLTSLAKCAHHLLGITMCKAKRIRMGNWELHPLSPLQSAYAALDAWIGCKGLERIEEHANELVPPDLRHSLLSAPRLATGDPRLACVPPTQEHNNTECATAHARPHPPAAGGHPAPQCTQPLLNATTLLLPSWLLKYRCPDPECAEPFVKWTQCLEHLKATGHAPAHSGSEEPFKGLNQMRRRCKTMQEGRRRHQHASTDQAVAEQPVLHPPTR